MTLSKCIYKVDSFNLFYFVPAYLADIAVMKYGSDLLNQTIYAIRYRIKYRTVSIGLASYPAY